MECLTDKEGKPFPDSKSELLTILAIDADSSQQLPCEIDGLVVDASVVIKSLAAFANSSNQGSYLQFAKYILRHLEKMASTRNATWLAIEFDTYHPNSIKNVTRDCRGAGVTIVFIKEEDLLPDDMKDFFLNEDNKKNFYEIVQRQAANPLFLGMVWGSNNNIGEKSLVKE